MTRREFLWAAPASLGVAGCLGLDPRVTPADITEAAAWADANNDFALELWARLRSRAGNCIISPFSIAASLALASAAAAGATQDEILRAVHWTGPADGIHGALGALERQIAAGVARSGCELRAAYALWTDKGVSVRSEFRALAEKYYAGAWQSTEFARPASAASAINHWAEMQTAFKIKALVTALDLAPSTRLLLAQAIYLRGLWAKTFPRAASGYDTFHVPRAENTTAPFMRQTARHRFAESPLWQTVELPLAGAALAMLIVIPRAIDGLPIVESSLNRSGYDAMIRDLQPQTVALALPKFRITAEWRLQPPLQELGMRQAFEPGEADFSRLASGERLAMAAAVQKASLEVNEDGAEGTAATGLAVGALSGTAADARPVVADRPFLIVVRDRASGSILFVGRLQTPY